MTNETRCKYQREIKSYSMNIYIIDISIKNKKYSLDLFGKSNNITYICSAHGAQKPRLLADE